MVNILLVSNVLLWLCVVSLVFIVLALLRQVGVLYERIAPAGALMMNQQLNVGDQAPQMTLPDLNSDKTISIGQGSDTPKSQLLFFLDAGCPVCKTLLPVLKSARQAESDWLQCILAGDAQQQVQLDFIKRQSLGSFTFVNSPALGKHYGVAKLPYAVLINPDGNISAMGLINSREHLESLFEAQEKGLASIQDYMQKKNNALLGES